MELSDLWPTFVQGTWSLLSVSTRESHPVALRRKALPRCSLRAVAAARFWPQGCPPALALAYFHDLHRLQSPGLLAQNRWETLHRETNGVSLP